MEGDDGVVALLGAATVDGLKAGLAVPKLVDDLLDHRLVDCLNLGLEAEVLVVAQLDLRPNLHGRLEDDRLALFGLGDLDLGRSQRREILLAYRLTEGILDEELDRLVQDGGGAENALDDRPRGLARTKAGDTVLL